MELRDLAYFEAIAETSNLGIAAQRVGRTKPALAKCIKRLEASVGAAIFVRSGRGIVLSPVGEVLYKRAIQMRASIKDIAREVSDFSHGVAGHLRIGAGTTPAENLLPDVCRVLLKGSPNVGIEITVGMSDVLLAALRDHKLDLVISPVVATAAPNFNVTVIGHDEVVVCCGQDHQLAKRRPSVTDLVGYHWVLPANSETNRVWLQRSFEALDLPAPQVQIESNSLSPLRHLIARTGLLSFLPRSSLERGRTGAGLKDLDIKQLVLRRKIGILTRKESYLPPIATRFIDVVREVLRETEKKAGSEN